MRIQKPHTPKLARQLLLRFLRSDLVEEVEGDLEEQFLRTIKNKSSFRAKLNYWYQVFNYLRPFALRKSNYHLTNHAMFQSYFKIGWRNLIHQKMYSSIKIGGFAIGIAACLMIALFIRQELSYDLNYANGDRIYRILRESKFKGERSVGVHFPAPFVHALRDEFPEIEKAGHYNAEGNFGAASNEVRRVDGLENSHEDDFAYMDQGLVDILELPFIAGNSKNALAQPNSIVITQSKAQKYFGHEDPIDKLFILNNDEGRVYKVTGVIEDFPTTSHFQFQFLMTMAGKEMFPGEQTNWRASNYLDYVIVRKGTNIAALENKLPLLIKNHLLPDAFDKGADKNEIEWLKSMSFHLQPVHDIYLNKFEVRDGLHHGDMRYILLFGAIAGFILLIACINFINLSTARSASRAKEVGLRKVVGSARSSLIKQFLTESILFSVLSFIIGALLTWILLPYFNQLLARTLTFPWNEWWFIPVLSAGAIVMGFIAGLYPSFYLSSFSPAKVLKGNSSLGLKGSSSRSVLVAFQFVISIVLIIGTIVIYRQMDFILNKKLGFDREQVMIVRATHTLGNQINTFKKELTELPVVKYASVSGFMPVDGTNRDGGPVWKEGMDRTQGVGSQHWRVDYDYIKTLGLKIIEGRDFSPQIASDSMAAIINEATVKELNLTDPIGKTLISIRGERKIIGIVADFHSESMKQSIQPLELYLEHSPQAVLIKLNTPDTRSAIESISAVWKKFSPNQPIRFAFLDESYARMYDDVLRMGLILTSFAILAIIVACLGLFALSAFMVEQRGKEISIRLVLGATLQNIFNLLTLNFIKLVLIAIVIAVPLAWYMMNQWLQDFKYKTEITWDIFLISGAMAALIAILTISYQSIKAALMKPVDGLKSE